MRIGKNMAYPASHQPSKQWKHLKTNNEPPYPGNYAAGAFIPGADAGGDVFLWTHPIFNTLIVDTPPHNPAQGPEPELVSPISAPQTFELRLVVFKYQ